MSSFPHPERNRLFLLVIILCFISGITCAQSSLVLYKVGKKKIVKYKVGETIRIKVKGSNTYNKVYIQSLTDSTIVSGSFEVRLDQIEVVKIDKNKLNGMLISNTGKSLQLSGLLVGTADILNGGFPVDKNFMILTGSAIVVGTILRRINRDKFVIDHKRRIKVINISND